MNWDECISTSWMTSSCNMGFWKINGRKNIGDLSYLYQKYQPKDYQDFYDKYTSDTTGDKPEHHGRTEEELRKIAQNYKLYANSTLDDDMFFKNLLWHIIVQTYEGHKQEQVLIEYMNQYELNASSCNPDMDAVYGTDIEATYNNKKFYVQVKPITFFYGNNNQSLLNDRINAIKKYNKTIADYNAITYYVIYEKGKDGEIKWWYNEKGKLFNKLSDLIAPTGITKFNKYNGQIK